MAASHKNFFRELLEGKTGKPRSQGELQLKYTTRDIWNILEIAMEKFTDLMKTSNSSWNLEILPFNMV